MTGAIDKMALFMPDARSVQSHTRAAPRLGDAALLGGSEALWVHSSGNRLHDMCSDLCKESWPCTARRGPPPTAIRVGTSVSREDIAAPYTGLSGTWMSSELEYGRARKFPANALTRGGCMSGSNRLGWAIPQLTRISF